MKTRILILLAVLVIAIPGVLAADQIIANSNDWRDVYSTTIYANLQKIPSSFLISSRHATLLLYQLPDKQDVEIIAGRQPWVVGYDDILSNRKGSTAEELQFNNVNLELAKRLTNIRKFIIVDDAYGYNALSVASYASTAGYYVLFTNERNGNEVANFLRDRQPTDVIIYGQVNRAVKQRLSEFNPETINQGDRFDNNLEIVKRYLSVKPSKQAILTNGEFIESSIMSGTDPVIFIGRDTVPEQVRTFLKDEHIDVGILVGNELVGSATFVRRQTGISVFVKFAQGARNPAGPISQVEDLDRFPMPRIQLNLEIFSVTYNKATNRLEVTLRNTQPQGAWFKNTVTLNSDGQSETFGDDTSLYIEGNDYRTITYPATLLGDQMTATVFTIYGESPKSLELSTQKTLSVDIITILDETVITLDDLKYNTRTQEFLVKVTNTGSQDAYVTLEMHDVLVNGEYVSAGSTGVTKLSKGDSTWIPVPLQMAAEDITQNPTVNVRAYYGGRENILTKVIDGEFAMKISKDDYVYYVLILVLIILVLLILFSKKKCKHCSHKNKLHHRHCKKCGKQR
ncbi:MAG: hypothetical protein ABIA93_05475 [Candidatus Woesearchaeota archaeon]